MFAVLHACAQPVISCICGGENVSYDRERAADLVLALMQLTVHERARTWKSYDWEVMNDLFERGYISDPKSNAKSVVLSEAGMERSKEMFAKHLAPEQPG